MTRTRDRFEIPPAPTRDEILRALEARFDHPTDRYARDMAWVDYLSDGLLDIWPPDHDADGDSIGLGRTYPGLERRVDEAKVRITRLCRAIAVEELTAAAEDFDRVHPFARPDRS